MTKIFTPYELESLLIQKISEKYQLNERDLRRAFSRFDKDSSGQLDLNELKQVFKRFLNGISDDQIGELISCYDVNGDNTISFEEFLNCIQHRTAVSKSESTASPRGHRQRAEEPESSMQPRREAVDVGESDRYSEASRSVSDHSTSEAPSEINADNPMELENRVKAYLQGLKSLLVKKANELKMQGRLADHLTLSLPEVHRQVAGRVLAKAFQPYSGEGDGRARNHSSGVDKADFFRVLRSIKIPGSSGVRPEVLDFVFRLCRGANYGDKADPAILTALMFPEAEVQRHGVPTAAAAVDRDFVADKEVTGRQRPLVASGPMKSDGGLAATGGFELTQKPKASAATNIITNEPMGNIANPIDMIPLRFMSRKSKTALITPANFDTNNLRRSAQTPAVICKREFIFGLSPTLQSGPIIHALPSAAPAYAGTSQRSKSSASAQCKLVYAAAAVGVVHDLATNTQQFFNGHIDDISCVALSPSGQFVATGCVASVGKRLPKVLIWDCMNLDAPENGLICEISSGFFQRSVAAATFSFDSTLLCGIGCDDNHRLGIWSFGLGRSELLIEVNCLHGLPDDIKGLAWGPAQIFTEWINRDHTEPCDIICTAGEKHLRLWSFRRPSSSAPSVAEQQGSAKLSLGGAPAGVSLNFKALVIDRPKEKSGSTSGTQKPVLSAPKRYNAIAFSSVLETGEFDLVSGGSNGIVYCWRKGVCVLSCQAIRGGISSLSFHSDRIYCGGPKGIVKVIDGRSMQVLSGYSLTRTPEDISVPGSSRSEKSSKTGSVAASKASAASKSAAEESQQTVTGLAVVAFPTIGGSGGGALASAARGQYLVATTNMGVAFKIDLVPGKPRSSSGKSMDKDNRLLTTGFKPLFYYHTDSVMALDAERSVGNLIVTGGDDRRIYLWDSMDKICLGTGASKAAVRTLHLNRGCSFLATGTAIGTISLHSIVETQATGDAGLRYVISEEAFRKDSKEEISDVKFSPNNEMVAAASHDNYIRVYRCRLAAGACQLNPLHRLSGHSSYVTHIDWSVDSALLQSTCGAYELLCWDVLSGRLFTGCSNSDIQWKTQHCILGFNVMGIWPPYSDGTDINAVDVNKDKGLVATGDDSGFLNILNFPCVVKNAGRLTCAGHSSHVMNVRFFNHGGDDLLVITVGGRDTSIMLWRVERTASVAKTRNYTNNLF